MLRLLVPAALVALAASPCALVGADKEGKKEVTTKATRRTMATSVDFGGSLGMSLQCLRTLGSRIDSARSNCDPVVLTELARELTAAEEVAGKTAELTGKDLMKQATEMARYRNRPEELKVVARLCGDDKMAGDLNAQADKAADTVKTRAREIGSVRTKGIVHNLEVVNNTPFIIRVSVNFVDRGEVAPYDTAVCYVGDSATGTTYLYAYAPGTSHQWSKEVPEPVWDGIWTLTVE
jgi:hypothetical protein